MSSTTPDPEPDRTPGLDDGAGVRPGETPPAETSATAGLGEKQPDLPSRRTNALVYGIVIAVTLLVALLFVGYAVGLFD